jgi:hypothetical protein
MPVIIVAGGMSYQHQPLASVAILVLSKTPHWVKMADLKQPRSWYPVFGLVSNRLFVAAGTVRTNLTAEIFTLLAVSLYCTISIFLANVCKLLFSTKDYSTE